MKYLNNENKVLQSRSTLSTEPCLYQETLEWLVHLAKQPGWKAQAWHRAKELEACPTRLWLGIKTDLTNHMKAQYESISDK
jgi:hypothetical protein